MEDITLPLWNYAYGGPDSSGTIRVAPEDFRVTEIVGFEPSGNGEHCFIKIEKTGENTEFVARELARFSGISKRDIGYAGLKDRHAVTTQWFSAWLPGKPDPDWKAFQSDSVKIIQTVRHTKKLKRGALSGNSFQLLIRDWQGDRTATVETLNLIKANGIPNYFGPQRFGMNGQNINRALVMFAGERVKRHLRSIYISAVRSFLFNRILSCRVQQQNWNQAIPGDAFIFDQSGAYFRSEPADATIEQRVKDGEIHPTGSLSGKGDSDLSADALALEMHVFKEYPQMVEGLLTTAVEMSRRALRVNVDDLCWKFSSESELKIDFFLPAGSYATSLLREIIEIKEPKWM